MHFMMFDIQSLMDFSLFWIAAAVLGAIVYGFSLGSCGSKSRQGWQDNGSINSSPMHLQQNSLNSNPLYQPKTDMYQQQLWQQQPMQQQSNMQQPMQQLPNMQQPMQQLPNMQQPMQYMPNMQQPMQYMPNMQQPMQQLPNMQQPMQQLPNMQPHMNMQPPFGAQQPQYVQQQMLPHQHLQIQQLQQAPQGAQPSQPPYPQQSPHRQPQLPNMQPPPQPSGQQQPQPSPAKSTMPMVLCANCRAKLYAPPGGIFKCPHCMATQRLPPEMLNNANATLGATCNVPGCSCQDFTATRGEAKCSQCSHKKSMHKVARDDINVEIKLPSHWEGDTTKSQRKQVSTEIKQAVQHLMDGTWKNVATKDRVGDKRVFKYEVVQVLRNQNPRLWVGYALKREVIRAELAARPNVRIELPKTAMFHENALQAKYPFAQEPLHRDCNEMFLFHGTKPSAADSIAENAFKLSFSGSNRGTLFGPGIYFAESSSKSDEYAQDDQEGLYQGLYATLLCRVVMGNYTYNAEHRPNADELTKSCLEGASHSVLGDRERIRGTFREFVVFDHEQAYPEFIIIYRRVQ